MAAKPVGVDQNLVFDVGLHKGEDSDFYLKKGFRVVGFEANPLLVEYCKKRFAEQIDQGTFILVEGAIIDAKKQEKLPDTIKFYRNMDDTVWGTVCEDWAVRNEGLGTKNEIIEVPVVDFSACIEKFGMPYYLKIDIEGMDKVCLTSLLGFEEKPSYISIESEKVAYEKLLEEFDLFSQLGYDRFKAVQQSGISRQKEPIPAREGEQSSYGFKEGSSGLFGKDLPGKWQTHDQILRIYKKIFFLYEYFGDFGKWRRKILGRIFREVVSTVLRKPIPGWYDTHARHHTIQD